MSAPRSVSCDYPDCNERPAKAVKCPYLSRLCQTHRGEAKTRYGLGIRDPLTEAQFNEFVGQASIDATPVNEHPSTLKFSSDDEMIKHIEAMKADSDDTTVNHSVCSCSSSDAEEFIDNSVFEEESASSESVIHEEEEESALESDDGDVYESTEEDNGSSVSDKSDIENNGNEMDSSIDAPVVSSSPDIVDTIRDIRPVEPSEHSDDAVHAEFSDGWDDAIECSDSNDKDDNDLPQQQQKNPPKYPVLCCFSFNASMVYGETTTYNKNTKEKSIKQTDQTSSIVEFERIGTKALAAGLDLTNRVGTSWTSNYLHRYTFCEWVSAQPKIYKQTIDPQTFNPIIDESTVEAIDIPGYHPHFDIDVTAAEYSQLRSILTEVQLFELYLYMFNRFAEAFGSKVSISAYTNVAAIHDKYPKCPCYKDCSKVISIHVCYYECLMTATDLELLGARTFPTDTIKIQLNGKEAEVNKPKQSIKYAVNGSDIDVPLYGIDGSIFKIKNGQGRKWRHHCSVKGKYDSVTKKLILSYYPGAIINDDSLDHRSQLVHPRGGEKIISYADVIKSDKWLPVYEISEKTPAKQSHKRKTVKVDSKMGINDIEWTDSVISMPSNAILELFDEVAPNHDHTELQSIICAFIGNCPMDAASAESLIEQWYNKKDHQNGFTVAAYMKYYSYSESNIWFWALLKHLPDDRKDYYKETYAPLHIDKSVHINNSGCTIDDDGVSQSFGIDETGKVLEYMRGCIGCVDQRLFVKKMHDGTPVVSEYNENGLRAMLDGIHPFKGNWNIHLYHLFRKYKDFFRYSACKLYNPTDTSIDPSKTINMFQGYKYTPRVSHKLGYEVVTPLLNHIKEVICRGDDFKYNAFIKNLAFYIKKPGQKLGIIPIVWGAGKGSGKTIVFDIICDILGDKAAMNNASMKDAFGDFNPHVDTTVLCIINEAPNWEQGHVNAENVTRAATEVKTVKNMKGISQYIVDSFTNYVITCNEPNPLKEGFENRRTQYYHADDKYVGNRKYFKALMKNIQPDGPKTSYDRKAMETILHYFLHEVDINDYDPEEAIYDELMRFDVVYNDKLERAYESGGKVLQEIVDHFESYIDGITFEDIQLNMTTSQVGTNTLRRELAKYAVPKQKTIGKGKRVRLYYMNKDRFLYSLIKYKCQENECDISKLDEYFKDVLSNDTDEDSQLDIRPDDM